MNKRILPDAILALAPGAEFSYVSGKLNWVKEEIHQPSWEEIVQKVAELEYQEEVNEYQRQRAREYPSYADQFDQIFHEGVDAWKATIQEVKDKYPKQTMDVDELQRRKDQALSELQQES